MNGDPIELNRAEVKELWDFMAEVREVLKRTEAVLSDHEQRIRANHEEMIAQRSERAFTRWVLPVVLSLGAVAVSIWGVVKRQGG